METFRFSRRNCEIINLIKTVKLEPEERKEDVRDNTKYTSRLVSVSYRRVQYASIVAIYGQCYR